MTICFRTDKGDRLARHDHAGVSLSDMAQDAGLFLNTRCGGRGACGGCVVTLTDGEFRVAGERFVAKHDRTRKALACQTAAVGAHAVVRIAPSSLIEISGRIEDDFLLRKHPQDAQTKKFFLKLPPADMRDPASDRARMERELAKQTAFKNIYFPLDALQKLPHVLARGNREITLTIGRIRNYWFLIHIEPGDTTHTHLALAVDIGTTTVVAALVDLWRGVIVARGSRYNQQITQADDVASRISFCRSQKEVRRLQKLVVEDTLNPIIQGLCENARVAPEQINRVVISGNTVMSHLFLGLSPRGIGKLPFQPVTLIPGEYLAGDVGLRVNPQGIIDIVPSISGYIGGDITSNIYVAGIMDTPLPTLLVDIGTNGEIVFSADGGMSACATAAGPALEGAGPLHGCRASTGAIEKVAWGDDHAFHLSVIGGGDPVGVCGSGMIDFLGTGLAAGFMTPRGHYDVAWLKKNGIYRHAVINAHGARSHACVLVKAEDSGTGCPIVVTEADIARILQAKAAIYAGMKTLIHMRGRTFRDIKRFILAGGFARHINLENAIRIGLLPDIPRDRIEVIGNGSLAGAFLALIDPDALNAYRDMIALPEVVELNLTEDFESHYIDALFLPNMRRGEFEGADSVLGKYA